MGTFRKLTLLDNDTYIEQHSLRNRLIQWILKVVD